MKQLHLLFALLISSVFVQAQTDTVFWFAAPEVSIHTQNFDRPIVLRITTYSQAASVTISQPAGGGMPAQVVNIPANNTQTVDLTNWIDLIENKPPNATLNYGLKIQSTSSITVYYEVVSSQCQCNPEIFVLKGGNALGTDFWIPSQNYLNNNNGYSPVPYSSFDIIATQNNTTVTIIPSNAIVGHAAGVPFNIVLNEGQTYSATAASFAAAQHLQGSRVTSDKPIAITVKDDLLNGAPFGGCADLGGDQIVPVNLLGTEYVAMNGFLNAPGDQLFITATQNNTTISKNGAALTTINAGQTYQVAIAGASAYIQTSAPAYVWQMSGFGCEVGLDLIPPIICTGSFSVSITRSTTESLFINVMVQNGGQGNFTVNGNAGVITAGMFAAVPGTGGQWLSAQVTLPAAQYPQNTAIVVSNSSSLFHLGMIHGGSSSGTRFGYFSNFAKFEINAVASAPNVCAGSAIQFNADSIPLANYSWTGPAGFSSNLQNPFIASASLNNSGDYIVTASVLGCASNADTVNVQVLNCFPDSDGDGITDEYDIDDDNDGISDVVECGNGMLQNLIVNGSFEQPVIAGTNVGYFTQSNVPGWLTTSTDTTIEIWANGFNGVPAYAGNQHAEINYTQMSALYQDVATTPSSILVWYFAHRGRAGVDVMQLRIGAPGNTQQQGQFSSGNTAWNLFTGSYIVPAGQTITRFEFQAISTASGSPAAGNFIDDVAFYDVMCYADDDGDGIPNSLDLDSDNDGIYDLVEAGHGMPDADNDGRIDGPNSAFGQNGLYNAIETTDNINANITYTVKNTDGAGAFDFLSLDSDGEGCFDVIEAGYVPSLQDADGLLGTATPVVNANGVVQGAGGYTTPLNSTGTAFDFQNAAYNGCECHIVYQTTVNTAICYGSSYTLPGGAVVTAAGTYIDTLHTVPLNCDSIITTNLTVHPTPVTNVYDTICANETYTLPSGNIVNTQGIYTDTLVTTQGCDSVVITELTVHPLSSSSLYDTICTGSSYTLPDGSSVTAAGAYTVVLQNQYGCDSIVTVQLTLRPIDNTTVYDTTCNGSTFALPNGNTVTASGSYPVTLQNQYGCDSVVTTVLTVIQVSVSATASNVLCFGGNNGSVTASASAGVNPYNYNLLLNGNTIANNTSGSFPNLSAGNYTVSVTDNFGCSASANALVNEPALLQSTFVAQNISCFGAGDGSVSITATGGTPAYSFSLNSSSNNSGAFNSLTAGNYNYTVTDANGCTDNGSLVITEPDEVLVTITPNPAEMDLGASIQLNASSNYGSANYVWNPTTGLSCSDCANPQVAINHSITYYVTASVDINGNTCTGITNVPLTVIPNYDIFIPNVFTPNNDGNNDYFQIYGNLTALKFVEVQIFNRTGEKVFETNDINFKWNGTYKDKPLEPQVFVYTIFAVFVDNHAEKIFKGSLTLLK
ncbi:MAG: gliding motility-associated C-terminal domain-containing protein [Chitinophagales bacterium]|nr:gliding motility-associated C-terminal domain-containing protein [Chitinophagales bacterium]